MIGVVIGLYFLQQENVQSMVISPMEVLQQRDDLEVFEQRELNLIKNSLEDASGSFGTQEFIDSFRTNFFLGFDFDMNSFFRYESYKNDNRLDLQDGETITNGIYPPGKTYYSGGTLIFTRDKVYRKFRMEGDSEKVVFPVDFYFEFDREYRISYVNGEFEVE
jgi:hypothetical protein